MGSGSSPSTGPVFGAQHVSQERPLGSGPEALLRVSWAMTPSRRWAWAVCKGVRAAGGTQSSQGVQGTSSTAAPPADLVVSLTGHSLGSPCGCGHGPCGGLSSKLPGAGTRSFRSHDSQS